MGDTVKASKKDAITIRRGQALQLRVAGASIRAIAKALNVSVRTAWLDITTELDKVKESSAVNAEHLIAMELQRLDVAVLGLQAHVQAGEANAAFAWVKVSESRRKLLGLDKPTKVAPTSPDGGQEYGTDARTALAAAIAAALEDAATANSDEPE